MRKSRMQRGSALLMVLGMLSFLIISAVSFSMYMRQTRVPSSFLRQKVSSRMLGKAALARAMDAVDAAVNNNPHPGVGSAVASNADGTRMHNAWAGRVLYGFGTNDLCGVGETIPTLTLEGLAYLPPAIVNAVRYYSRRTRTAGWHTFNYDVGRYAFTAVDVSDYFDVNRMLADRGRSSASATRVNLAYLFEEGLEHESAPQNAKAWDTFMDQFRTVDHGQTDAITYEGGTLPLVSLADFNLALGAKGSLGDLKSYFYDYVTGGGNRGFYNSSGREDEDRVSRMTFVTDSLSAGHLTTSLAPDREDESGASTARTRLDLSDAENQPFKMDDLASESRVPLLSVIMNLKSNKEFPALLGADEGTGSKLNWTKCLSGYGLGALWDYLDYDSDPISLCIPTTERHPMICGMQFYGADDAAPLKVKREYEGGKEPEDGSGTISTSEDGKQTCHMKVKLTYRLDFAELSQKMMAAQLRTLVVYPFADKYKLEGESWNYKLDGRASLFLSSGEMKLRADSDSNLLRLGDDEKENVKETGLVEGGVGIIHCKFTGAAIPDLRQKEREEDVFQVFGSEMSLREMAPALAKLQAGDNSALLTVVYEWDQTKDKFGGSWSPSWKEVYQSDNAEYINKDELKCSLCPVKPDGSIDEDYRDSAKLLTRVSDSGNRLQLNLAAWLRIKGEDKFVDLVPACVNDDETLNGDQVQQLKIRARSGEFGGLPYPLMKFQTKGRDDSLDIPMSIKSLREASEPGSEQTFEFNVWPRSLVCPDPRWNFAPEQWVATDGEVTAESWLEFNRSRYFDREGYATDIFMATSDQGYLQSIYELAMLPRFKKVTLDKGAVGDFTGDVEPLPAERRSFASDLDEVANHDFMWRMHDIFGDENAAFASLPFTSAGRGPKVNPYSGSTNVLMAAFANTPIDWRVASTNDDAWISERPLTADKFNTKYAYCAYSDNKGSKLEWQDYLSLVGIFKQKMRGEARSDWNDVWSEFEWEGDSSQLWGQEIGNDDFNLWGVDKRYLFGYWHDCFAAEQQLFLIFVRSEPLMMGGGSINLVPPQLGTHAMALVWRDPKAPKDGSKHRMRVLFYRQFE